MKVSVVLGLSFLIFATIPPSDGSQEDINDELFLWKRYVQPELQLLIDFTRKSCAARQKEFNLTEKARAFEACAASRTSFRFNSSETGVIHHVLNQTSALDSAHLFNGLLKNHLLGPLCTNLPNLIACFAIHLIEEVHECWGDPQILSVVLAQRLLPVFCMYNGTRVNELLDTRNQDCLRSYLNKFEHCYNSSWMKWKNQKSMIIEDAFCEIFPCMLFLGGDSPCPDPIADASIRFLLEDIQTASDCGHAHLVNVIHFYHQQYCSSAGVPFEAGAPDDIDSCIKPFFAFKTFLLQVTNGSMGGTTHVGYLASDVEGFRSKINLICDDVLYDRACERSIKDVVERCYVKADSKIPAFVSYFEAFLVSECERNGSRIIELFERDDLACLLSQVNSVWTCYKGIDSGEASSAGLCQNLGLLHSCSMENMDSCSKESLAIVKSIFVDTGLQMSGTCRTSDSQSIKTSDEVRPIIIFMIVFPLAAAGLCLVLHVTASLRRLRRRTLAL